MNINIVSFLLIIIIFCCLFQNSNRIENIENNKAIVLLGDSIYQNKKYVKKNESVEYILTNKIKKSIVLAEDNSMIHNVMEQYEQMPTNLNHPDTYLFISIGGNDLLNSYKYNGAGLDDYYVLDKIFEMYEKAILSISEKTKCKIVLTDIYFIRDENHYNYYPLINMWNTKLYSFCEYHNFGIYKISNLLVKKDQFVNNIEPSFLGSKIIVDGIINF